MNVERLQLMIDLLKVIPSENFNIGRWSHECNTIACAVGWATVSPAFNALGFRSTTAGKPGIPIYESEDAISTHWRAVNNFFEIDTATARWMFNFDGYMAWSDEIIVPDDDELAGITAEDVIDHINRAIADSPFDTEWVAHKNKFKNWCRSGIWTFRE